MLTGYTLCVIIDKDVIFTLFTYFILWNAFEHYFMEFALYKYIVSYCIKFSLKGLSFWLAHHYYFQGVLLWVQEDFVEK